MTEGEVGRPSNLLFTQSVAEIAEMDTTQVRRENGEPIPEKTTRTSGQASASHEPPRFTDATATMDVSAPRRHPAPHEPGPDHHAVPDLHRQALHDPRLQQPAPRTGQQGETTPYHILHAHEILQRVIPFVEQEFGVSLRDSHANLLTWTTAI